MPEKKETPEELRAEALKKLNPHDTDWKDEGELDPKNDEHAVVVKQIEQAEGGKSVNVASAPKVQENLEEEKTEKEALEVEAENAIIRKEKDTQETQLKRVVRWSIGIFALILVGVACVVVGFLNIYSNGEEKPFIKSYTEIRKKAEQGDALYQGVLGGMLRRGDGVRKNVTEALSWTEKSNDQNHPIGLYNLAMFYKTPPNDLIEKDELKAKALFKKSFAGMLGLAKKGNPVAQANLGAMYEYGYGIEENKKEAVKWYRKASEQGHARGQYVLARMYYHGEGVKKDTKEALKWLRRALEQVDARGQIDLAEFLSVISVLRYQKIAANGNRLADNARQWSCVSDTETGLMWEVKTNGGLHDKDKTYLWGGKGVSQIALGQYLGNKKRKESRWDGEGERYNDWNALVDGTNGEALCGHSDWRVPTLYELSSLVYCSNGAYDLNNGCSGKNGDRKDYEKPTINTDYFPNSEGGWFWSASPFAGSLNYAWGVTFNYGYSESSYYRNGYSWRVRLVRGGQ